jgi:hypothetical protein
MDAAPSASKGVWRVRSVCGKLNVLVNQPDGASCEYWLRASEASVRELALEKSVRRRRRRPRPGQEDVGLTGALRQTWR